MPGPQLADREGWVRSAGHKNGRRRPLAPSRGGGNTTQSRRVPQATACMQDDAVLGSPSFGVIDAGGRVSPRGRVGRSVRQIGRSPAPRHLVPGINNRAGTAGTTPEIEWGGAPQGLGSKPTFPAPWGGAAMECGGAAEPKALAPEPPKNSVSEVERAATREISVGRSCEPRVWLEVVS